LAKSLLFSFECWNVVLRVFKGFSGRHRVYCKVDFKRRCTLVVVEHGGNVAAVAFSIVDGCSKLRPSWLERRAVSAAKSLARAVSEYAAGVPGGVTVRSLQVVFVHFNETTSTVRLAEYGVGRGREYRWNLALLVERVFAETVDGGCVRVGGRGSVWFHNLASRSVGEKIRKVKVLIHKVLAGFKNLVVQRLGRVRAVREALVLQRNAILSEGLGDGVGLSAKRYMSDRILELEKKIQYYSSLEDELSRLKQRIMEVEGEYLLKPVEEILAEVGFVGA